MTEKEKMLGGKVYNPADKELSKLRLKARKLCRQFNKSTETEKKLRVNILKDLFENKETNPWIEPPFHCDYGFNIEFGEKVFLNFNCIILDTARIKIGNNVMLGPGVHIYTAQHPIDPTERSSFLEYSSPVSIGNNVWIGGGVIICPGVIIGEGSVIGAGSVVCKDIPPRVVAAGNPCRVLRKIEESDKIFKKN